MDTTFDIHTLWLNLYPAPYDYEGELAKLRRYEPAAAFHLWDREKTKPLAEAYQPGLWNELFRLERPVMVVDILRWLVVYRYGGLYWQLGCVPWRPMGAFFPEKPEIECRLWTENVMSPEECRTMAAKPIRQGKPEESIRVANQVFFCRKGAKFAGRMVAFLLERARKWTPKEDYDVLYITANAAVSEAYDRFGKDDPHVELVGLAETRQMVRWKYGGMWRQDARREKRTNIEGGASRQEPPFGVAPVGGAKERAKGLVYRLTGKHPHERLWRNMGADWTGAGARQALEEGAGEWLKGNGVRRIAWIPAEGLDSRRFRNLLYEGAPRCDLLLAADWFEWLPDHEIQRIWSQVVRSGCQWLAATTCPLLETNRNTAVGEFRPLNLEARPYAFGRPVLAVPISAAGRRSDRVLAVWNCRAMGEGRE